MSPTLQIVRVPCLATAVVALIVTAGTWATASAQAQPEAATPKPPTKVANPAYENDQNQETRTALKAAEEKSGAESEAVLRALQDLARHLESDESRRKELIAVLERMLPLVKTLRGNGGMEAADIRKLKDLEDENHRLKQMYADLSLENRALKDVITKKL